ncbi:MAG: MerR family transcriptional regulator [Eubacterium sp.]|nr:MerR family transcriptional regulator [Eubacterium sp.]
MVYTVGEIAKMMNVPASTLRYYDKEGLLPFVERSNGGIRMFKESDYEFLQIINCLKKTGMSLSEIKTFIDLVMQGDDSIDERLQLFLNQREKVLKQMEELQETLNVINYKVWYYETAKKEGTTKTLDTLSPCDLPDKYRPAKEKISAQYV